MKSDKAKNLILIVEIIGFLLLILIVWLDELINLPGYLFGSKVHQIDLEEAVVETIVISTLGIIVIAITWYQNRKNRNRGNRWSITSMNTQVHYFPTASVQNVKKSTMAMC